MDSTLHPRGDRLPRRPPPLLPDRDPGRDPPQGQRGAAPLEGGLRHLAPHPERQRARGAALAQGMGRPRLVAGAALHPYRGATARRRAAAASVQRVYGRAGDRHFRLGGAEAAFLPATANVDIWWCQGYSEPGAGSDLASLKTTARRRAATTTSSMARRPGRRMGHYADWIFCLVRTDPEAKKQEGISFLLIDMKSPGITVRPIITIDGGHEVNEVFFDNVQGAGREPGRRGEQGLDLRQVPARERAHRHRPHRLVQGADRPGQALGKGDPRRGRHRLG